MTSVIKTNQCFEEVNPCNPGLLQRRRSSSSSKDPDTKITQLNKDTKIQIAFGVMCCLPSHALLVLCPSGLLSHGGSACQLTICMCACVWLLIPATPPPQSNHMIVSFALRSTGSWTHINHHKNVRIISNSSRAHMKAWRRCGNKATLLLVFLR